MGTGAGPELVAAGPSAGACSVLGTSRVPASLLRQRIQRVRALTDKPFGANRILAHPQEGQIEVCFDERVPLPILSVLLPEPGFEGDLEYAALDCGESCSLVKDIEPAADIVRDMVREAEGVIAQSMSRR